MKRKIAQQTVSTQVVEIDLVEGMCFRDGESVIKILPQDEFLKIYSEGDTKIYSVHGLLDSALQTQITQREFYEASLTAIQTNESHIKLIQEHL